MCNVCVKYRWELIPISKCGSMCVCVCMHECANIHKYKNMWTLKPFWSAHFKWEIVILLVLLITKIMYIYVICNSYCSRARTYTLDTGFLIPFRPRWPSLAPPHTWAHSESWIKSHNIVLFFLQFMSFLNLVYYDIDSFIYLSLHSFRYFQNFPNMTSVCFIQF